MQNSQAITRKSASNLALAFILLPRAKRDSMSALYAFCREVDDVADEDSRPVEDRRAALQRWREDIRLACAGGTPTFPVNQELQPIIQRCNLPLNLFEELIAGVEMDLDISRYETFETLEQYCYRVASVVGLLSIEIFGYRNPKCREYAVYLGKALQLTNILRDVATDAERGRIYLPVSAMDQAQVREGEILDNRYSERYAGLAKLVAQRARYFYARARETLPAEDRRSMVAAELMGSVYWRLLRKLEQRDFNVFDQPRTRIGSFQKVFLIARTWFRLSAGIAVPNYGIG